ncbi:MAG: tyrosine-protein phosphatase [Defluviitaleaceae bacterium]|nr:tyrosine-protein phosphatase [Defluviitaleaceae bacterium]
MNGFVNLLNFRDLGGIKVADGRAVRPRRLLRAALPVGLSEGDVSALRGYDLRHIVDFRTVEEVADSPVDRIDGVTYTHIDIMGENEAQAACPKFWMELFEKNPNGVVDEFTRTYKEFSTGQTSTDGYSKFIKSLCKAEGATLFHCTAGKDRTGYAAALLLRILGINESDFIDDYLKSLEYQRKIHSTHVDKAKKRGLSDEQIEKMGVIFNVNESYIHAAFQAAEETYGSFEGYVKDGLKLSEGDIAQLMEGYLE